MISCVGGHKLLFLMHHYSVIQVDNLLVIYPARVNPFQDGQWAPFTVLKPRIFRWSSILIFILAAADFQMNSQRKKRLAIMKVSHIFFSAANPPTA